MVYKCYEVKPRTFIKTLQEKAAYRIAYEHPGIFKLYDFDTRIERYVNIGNDGPEVSNFAHRLANYLSFDDYNELTRAIWRENWRAKPGMSYDGPSR